MYFFSLFRIILILAMIVVVAVTTAQNAITALNLLRENKNNFDLVISNVHMPDMDGFQLLELVGLEMDLPVISKLICNFQHFMLLIHDIIIDTI